MSTRFTQSAIEKALQEAEDCGDPKAKECAPAWDNVSAHKESGRTFNLSFLYNLQVNLLHVQSGTNKHTIPPHFTAATAVCAWVQGIRPRGRAIHP